MMPRPKIVAWLSWLALNTATCSMQLAEAAGCSPPKKAVIFVWSTIGSGICQPTR